MSEEPWSYDRVQRMISDGIEENLHLDYKAAGSLAKVSQKRDEIVKDVTAFANSDGGVIIYGVQEFSGQERSHLPEKITPINRADFSKEWLEQVISNAAPRIAGIRIHPITVPEEETMCLYVVEIPKGETAHQASDCKYYRRYNFESVPMRDHELRDVMNRVKNPRIEVEAFLGLRNPWEESSFRLKLTNVGPRLALHYCAVVRLPPEIKKRKITPDGDDFTVERDQNGHSYFVFSLGQSLHKTPLFPSAGVMLKRVIRADVSKLEMIDGLPLNPLRAIHVKVYADEMHALHCEFDPASILGKWNRPRSNEEVRP